MDQRVSCQGWAQRKSSCQEQVFTPHNWSCLLLLLFVVAFAAVAQRLKTPYRIVLVVAGLLLGFVPGLPRITFSSSSSLPCSTARHGVCRGTISPTT